MSAFLRIGIPIALAVGAVIAGFAAASPAPRPHCPDGYALAGGGFAGALHCVPGAEVEWR